MKTNEIKKGMTVRIDKYCHATHSTCTLVPEMRKYLDTVQTIQSEGRNSSNVKIQGYNWNPRDLIPVIPELTPMHEKHISAKIDPFDPNELDL